MLNTILKIIPLHHRTSTCGGGGRCGVGVGGNKRGNVLAVNLTTKHCPNQPITA